MGRGTDIEGLDIREKDTLTSKCRSSDVICFSLLGCRVFCLGQSCSEEVVQDIWFCGIRTVITVLRSLFTVYGSLESGTVHRL